MEGISVVDQRAHPDEVVNIVNFFRHATEGTEDETIYHKFDNALAPEMSQVERKSHALQSLASPVMGPMSPMLSPPASPRFPANNQGSFENPRAPPPIPQIPWQANGNLTPLRPAPRPPGAGMGASNFVPMRAAPNAPGLSKNLPSAPRSTFDHPTNQVLGSAFVETPATSAPPSRGRSNVCLLYTSPSPRDGLLSRMPSSA